MIRLSWSRLAVVLGVLTAGLVTITLVALATGPSNIGFVDVARLVLGADALAGARRHPQCVVGLGLVLCAGHAGRHSGRCGAPRLGGPRLIPHPGL